MNKWGLVVAVVVVLAVGLALAAGTSLWSPAARSSAPAEKHETNPAPTASLPQETPGASDNAAAAGAGGGMAAIQKASAANRYLFVFFWKEENQPTAAMRQVFQAATAKVADRADAVAVNVADPAENDIVAKFELDRAPMPLVLALAPNGAVTGGFPSTFSEQDLLGAFATPCTEQCVKALQENKLVLLCVQNGATKSNDAAMGGVRQFQADERFRQATEVVMLDPTDAREASFLGDLKINPKTPQAVTALLAPPGNVIAEFEGATSKDELAAALLKANSGCCPGGSCGPGGCPPQP